MVNFFSVTSGKLFQCQNCENGKLIRHQGGKQSKCQMVNFFIDIHIYSIIETAKANGLNVYTYLEYLLLYMPDTDWRNHPELLDDLMPWSEAVQAECK